MLLENSDAGAPEYYAPPAEVVAGTTVLPTLPAFRAYLEKTGRICPRPWCWMRFFILFQPVGEPPWLSSWWTTSNRDKQDLFLKQMEYLARYTDQFHAACRFLHELDREYWLCTTEKLASGHPERGKLLARD
jgi:hypothetical protein